MAKETLVSIRVDKLIEGSHIQFGVPVRFRPVVEDPNRHIRRFDQSRQTVSAIAPVSGSPYNVAHVWILWGDYDVEATLPSGELLSQELLVGPDTETSLEEVPKVVLRGEYSPNEWRSWGHFAGASLASENRRGAVLMAAHLDQTSSFTVSIGNLAQAPGTDEFNPSSWQGWFDYLEARYLHGPEYAPDIQLSGSQDGLQTRTEGGYGGTPLRILFSRDGYPERKYATTKIGERRTYAAITGQSGTRLFALPFPWGEEYQQTLFEMLAFEDGRTLRCDPVLRDERWSGLVAYLNRGRVDLASEILMSARDALFEKFENPLAAAIGGYVLLSSSESPDIEDSWPDWLDNLARRFPSLPDGPILRAKWLLAQNSEEHLEEAHNLLFNAVERGIPFFTTGVVWLIEGLEQTSLACSTCKKLLRVVRGVARSMDLSQAFTSFSIAKPQTREAESTVPDLHTPPNIELEEPQAQQALESYRTGLSMTQAEAPKYHYLTLDGR